MIRAKYEESAQASTVGVREIMGLLGKVIQQRSARDLVSEAALEADHQHSLDLAQQASTAIGEFRAELAHEQEFQVRVPTDQIHSDIESFLELDPIVSRIVDAVPDIKNSIHSTLRVYETEARLRLIEPLDDEVRLFVYRQLATELFISHARGHLIDEELRSIVLASGRPSARSAALPEISAEESQFNKSSYDLGLALGNPRLGVTLSSDPDSGEWRLSTPSGDSQKGFFNDPPRMISGSGNGYNWYFVPGATLSIEARKLSETDFGSGKLNELAEDPELGGVVLPGLDLPCVLFYAERPFSEEKLLFRLVWIDSNSEVRMAFVTGSGSEEKLGSIQEGFDYQDFRSLAEREYGLPRGA